MTHFISSMFIVDICSSLVLPNESHDCGSSVQISQMELGKSENKRQWHSQ
jgi:hypothetical protein